MTEPTTDLSSGETLAELIADLNRLIDETLDRHLDENVVEARLRRCLTEFASPVTTADEVAISAVTSGDKGDKEDPAQ